MSGWKTYLVSFVMAFVGVLAEKGDAALVSALVEPSQGKALLVSAAVMAFMRFATEITTVKKALNTPAPKSDGPEGP